MSKVKVSIAVDDAHLGQITEVAKNLESAGLEVEQTLSIVGVINGSIEADQMNALAQIAGVKAVEPEREFQLPPPDSEIQ